jgi:hypothetical protein
MMLGLTVLSLMVWCLLRRDPPTTLHHYGAAVMPDLVALNVWSITILIVLFGWLQVDIYRKTEVPRS